jgi:hypothetical protein
LRRRRPNFHRAITPFDAMRRGIRRSRRCQSVSAIEFAASKVAAGRSHALRSLRCLEVRGPGNGRGADAEPLECRAHRCARRQPFAATGAVEEAAVPMNSPPWRPPSKRRSHRHRVDAARACTDACSTGRKGLPSWHGPRNPIPGRCDGDDAEQRRPAVR